MLRFCCSRPALAVVLFILIAYMMVPKETVAQTISPQNRADLRQARSNALTNLTGRPLQRQYLYLLLPEPEPEVTVNFLMPVFFNSNAQQSSSGGTRSAETTHELKALWQKQLPNNLKLSALFDASSDRFASATAANGDAIYADFRAQYSTGKDDQEFQPFISYSPRGIFEPTFRQNSETSHDLTVGFDKAFAYDNSGKRYCPPGEPKGIACAHITKNAEWVFGFTGTLSRRFTDADASSTLVKASPSVTHIINEQWNVGLQVDFSIRWYDAVAGFSQRDIQINPILTLEFIPPATWFKGEPNQLLFGQPVIDFQLSFARLNSNKDDASYRQWALGPSIKTTWNFCGDRKRLC